MRSSKALALIAFYDFMVMYLWLIIDVHFAVSLFAVAGVFIGTWFFYWTVTDLED